MPRKRNESDTREILYGSPEYRAEKGVYERVVASRHRYREHCIERLVDEAMLYRAEQGRSDGFHRGRMSQRRRALLDCVKNLHEAMGHKPVTARDIKMQHALDRLGESGDGEANGPGHTTDQLMRAARRGREIARSSRGGD